MSSITNSYSSSLYSSYYQNPTNKTISTNVSNNVNLVNQDSKTTLLSDKEILSVINNQAQFYQQAWRDSRDKLGELYKSGKDEEEKHIIGFIMMRVIVVAQL